MIPEVKWSLVFKQTFLIMLFITLIAGCMFIMIRKQALTILTSSLQERAFQISAGTVSRMDQTFFQSMRIGELLAARLGEKRLSQNELVEVMLETLETAHEARPEILALAVAYEPGAFGIDDPLMQLVQMDESDTIKVIDGKNYTDKKWYSEPKELDKGIWCEPFIGDFVKEPLAIYSLPFYEKTSNGEKRFAGIVCVDLGVAFLDDMASTLDISDGGYAFILSKNGRIAAHPRKDWVFKESIQSVAENLKDADLAAIGTNMLDSVRGFSQYMNHRAEPSWIYYMPLESNSWSLGIVFPEKILFTKIRKLEDIFLVFGLFGFIVMFAVVALISIRVSRPLKRLAVVADQIGQGNFAVEIPVIESHDELGAFSKAFREMRISLVGHIEDIKNLTAAKEKIESELKVAQEIQKGILPEILPPFPKCDYFEIDAFLHPAREVGGDLYDFFQLSETKICIAIGDVSGKGVPASLFMAVTQTLHRGLAHGDDISPGEIVTKMNAALCNNNSAMMFVTYVFAVLDLKTGNLAYSNAGHNPFCVLRADGTIEMNPKKHGIPLGVRSSRVYGESEITLGIGDMLFFYTDGIPEAKNKFNEFYGNERLKQILLEGAEKKLSPLKFNAALSVNLAAYVGDAEQFDDITVLTLKLTSLA